jgi:RimJ/RimL family protein N-acetyltransferase
MIHELNPPESRKARQLFEPLEFHASCAAVLNGANPGRILVDDPLNPTAGFVVSPEAAYLSGDAGNSDFCTSLETFLRDTNNLGLPMWHLILVVSSERWTKRLIEMAGENGIVRYARRHYLCDCEGDLRALPPPPGVALKRIDEGFLAANAWTIPEHIECWIRNNWGSQAHFLSAGFGVATVCGAEVVAWSIADCVSEGICEIGIHTAPEWRRKGMGAFTANGAVRHAFSIGMKAVGWHCHEENVGSWRTAEKAGFSLERKYEEYRICEPSGTSAGPMS